jgi:hypothetical protein
VNTTIDVSFLDCKCTNPLSIAFLLDRPNNVGQSQNLNSIQSFLQSMVNSMFIGSALNQKEVGILQFISLCFETIRLSSNSAAISNAISTMNCSGASSIAGWIQVILLPAWFRISKC